MKRILLISVLLVLALSISFGQIAYKKGDQVGSAMIGLGSFVYASGASSSLPPLSLAYDYGYNENISFGGLISYTSASETYDTYTYTGGYTYVPVTAKWTWSYIIIGARAAYHYDLLHNSNIDTYGGVMLGYEIASTSSDNTSYPVSSSGSTMLFSGYVGGRYYFSPNLAAQAEIGFGLALLNIGVAYKF
jgi:hypothetical protein